MSRRWIVPAVALAAVLAAACSPDRASVRKTSPGAAGAGAPVQSEAAPADKAAAGQIVPPLPSLPPKVVRNASLEIRVGDGGFQRRFAEASSLAEQLGGFVASATTEQHQGRASSGTIVLRIPAERFQSALASLRGLGTVTQESQDGRDVTAEFVDLEARLRHARAQEDFYLGLMRQAKTVDEMIRVQQQLEQVQLRIEELQGQIQYVKDQTSLSSVSVRLFERGAAGEPTGLGRAWKQAVEAFQRVVAGIVVGLGWLAPFALLGVAGFAGWRIARPKARPAA